MMTIAIGNTAVEYGLYRTKAPKAYDGPVIDIYDGGDGEYRYLLVRADQVTWQSRRNESGGYTLEETNDIPPRVITETLWERVVRGVVAE